MESVGTATDRLRELAQLGAERAASAFGYFVGHDFETGTAVVRSSDASPSSEAGEASRSAPGGWGAGVFFEVEGDFRGHIAVLFSAPSCDKMLRILLGKQAEPRSGAAVESVLREVGNLLASHALSAVADRQGARVLASIPILVLDEPAVALESLLGGTDRAPGRVHAESEIWDREGELWSLLVFVPGPAGWARG